MLLQIFLLEQDIPWFDVTLQFNQLQLRLY